MLGLLGVHEGPAPAGERGERGRVHAGRGALDSAAFKFFKISCFHIIFDGLLSFLAYVYILLQPFVPEGNPFIDLQPSSQVST